MNNACWLSGGCPWIQNWTRQQHLSSQTGAAISSPRLGGSGKSQLSLNLWRTEAEISIRQLFTGSPWGESSEGEGAAPYDFTFWLRLPHLLMVVDLLNKWGQGQESLQDRVHVASLAQVGEPERKWNEGHRIKARSMFSLVVWRRLGKRFLHMLTQGRPNHLRRVSELLLLAQMLSDSFVHILNLNSRHILKSRTPETNSPGCCWGDWN